MGSLAHIRWVGGATGAGKSTVAQRLAERFGLATYCSDATMGVHADRLRAVEAPLSERFRRMSMDERWVLQDPPTMYRTFPWFHGEGFDMLLDDVRSLPASSVAVVEGLRLLPHLVRPHLSDLRHAVWLVPTPGFRQRAFAARSAQKRSAADDRSAACSGQPART